MTRTAFYRLVTATLCLGCLIYGAEAAAQMVEDNPTGGPLDTFRVQMLAAQGAISGTLTVTFWLLATIEFTFAMIMVALHEGGMEGFARELVIRVLFIGFFYTLLLNGADWVNSIVSTFSTLGSQAGGIGVQQLSPDGILDVAVTMMNSATDNFTVFDLQDSFALLFASGITFLALLLIAGNLALVLVEFYIVGYGGVLLLALGGSRWTSNYAIAYLKYAFSIGMKLFIFYVIAGVGVSVITDRIVNDLDVDMLSQWWSLAAFAVVLCIVASKAPDAVTGLLNGVSTQAAISMAAAARTAGTVAAGAAAGAAAGGAAAGAVARGAASAGTSAAGGAKAAGQAYALGAQQPGNTARNAAANLAKAGYAEAKAGLKAAGAAGSSAFPVGNSVGGRMAASMASQMTSATSAAAPAASGSPSSGGTGGAGGGSGSGSSGGGRG